MEKKNHIYIKGARAHNLKNIDVKIPRDKLVVITGLSGSGKSSLAFDTIYAEGQRRYVESLSTYARQFLGIMNKPDADNIEGLSPAISIEQKTRSRNPRSTVGTITEIYDYLRLLFARIGIQKCYKCNHTITKQSPQQIVDAVLKLRKKSKLYIIAPIIKQKKGEFKNLITDLLKQGFIRARIDGKKILLTEKIKLKKNSKHNIDIIIDRLILTPKVTERLTASIELGLKLGNGVIIIETTNNKEYLFNENLSCIKCSNSFEELEPRFFSFNSPLGACTACDGLGTQMKIDINRVVPNPKLSLIRGCITPIGEQPKDNWIGNMIQSLAAQYNFSYSTPWYKLPKEVQKILLYGTQSKVKINLKSNNFKGEYLGDFEGVINNLERRYNNTKSSHAREWIQQYMAVQDCSKCSGLRLKPEHLSVFVDNKNITDLTCLSISNLLLFLKTIKLSSLHQEIGKEIIKEIIIRLQFLSNVGLEYLSLKRSAQTLSGGESQRIRLAAQIGLQLVGVLYILDEPSIGLHARDNKRLIDTLIQLRDLGNTIIVVEHDSEMMNAADWIIDIGPGAGIHGGCIVAEGTPSEIKQNKQSITGRFLIGKNKIKYSKIKHKFKDKRLILKNASGNNLKNITLSIPLNQFICITGVSGSGKSTLINQTLLPVLMKKYYGSNINALPNDGIDGLLYLDKVIDINQSPIGKTPRSNPATYTGLFTHIRELFANVQESKIRGYKVGRFSFNVKGGRCEPCQGMGLIKVEMHFLPDMYVVCDNCQGKRFNRETLQIYYKDKNINDILKLSIEEASVFFQNHKAIQRKLTTLMSVGLGYIQLGQQATTLSGGESQRIKLSKELSKIYTGRTLYILDEPTTGLHFSDIQLLLNVLHDLVNKGNTVIIIEHNLDVIKTADWIIDLGPGGGESGGEILIEGSPENIIKNKKSYTAQFLKSYLAKNK